MASAVTKPRASTKKASTSKSRGTPMADRAQMVAEAAYYLAEQRGFSGGDPVRDWLDAEVLIDQMSAGMKRRGKSK